MLATGCRSATRVVGYPRADLEIPAGGNRGYLVGAPSASSGPWKSDRQMVETEVEVPAFSKRAGGTGGLNEMAPPEMDMSEESGSYTVKSGDTLWSTAASAQVYGDATKWRLLYDANRETLKSPDRLRAGMTLQIPRADAAGDQAAEAEPSGVTFTK